MNTLVDKNQERKSQSAANSVSQKQNGGKSTFQFVDNRPEAVTQRRLYQLINQNIGQQQHPIQAVIKDMPDGDKHSSIAGDLAMPAPRLPEPAALGPATKAAVSVPSFKAKDMRKAKKRVGSEEEFLGNLEKWCANDNQWKFFTASAENMEKWRYLEQKGVNGKDMEKLGEDITDQNIDDLTTVLLSQKKLGASTPKTASASSKAGPPSLLQMENHQNFSKQSIITSNGVGKYPSLNFPGIKGHLSFHHSTGLLDHITIEGQRGTLGGNYFIEVKGNNIVGRNAPNSERGSHSKTKAETDALLTQYPDLKKAINSILV